jgi:hypothetical protein
LFCFFVEYNRYPDYYKVIAKPIDMKMIRSRHGKYTSLTEWVNDFNLMFSNAQEFNMPDSQVYNDAVYPHCSSTCSTFLTLLNYARPTRLNIW